MVPVLMRRYGKNNLLVPLLVPSIIFGLVHGSNALFGANIGATVGQVINSVFVGVALTAIYLLSGNILIPMAVHTLHDILAFAFEGLEESNGIITEGIDIYGILDLGFGAILFVFAMYYMTRPKNVEKALELWNNKWVIPDKETAPEV